jgi:hypothetical protein
MSEFLKQFQAAAFVLSPMVLAGAGFVLVWLGLCLWLGGLRWLKVLSGFAGAGAGYAVALHFAGPQRMVLIVIAVITGMICIFLAKTTVAILGALLAALIAAMLFAMPTLSDAKTWSDSPRPHNSAPDVVESLTTLETYGQYLLRKGTQVIQAQGSVGATAAAIAGLAVLGVSFVIPRGICALTCAILGVAAIAIGLLLLLLYKGSKPMDYILERQTMFWAIALAMIGFGMLVDLALCSGRSKTKVSPEKNKAGDNK